MDIETIDQQTPLLGRQKVHDERSRAFALPTRVDRSGWRDKVIHLELTGSVIIVDEPAGV